MKKVLIAGAHTAVGRALAEAILARELELELIRATTAEHIADELTLFDPASITSTDLAVLTFDGALARGIAEGLKKLNKPILDLARLFSAADGATQLWPGLDKTAGRGLVGVGLVPRGLMVPIASVLEALRPFLPKRAVIASYESAASADQAGLDELSEQVRGVFSMRDVDPKVFPASLAFDTIPSLAGPGADPGLAEAELLAPIQARFLGQGHPLDLFATRVLVPTFSADAAVLDVHVDGTPDRETVAGALAHAPLLRLSKDPAPPSLDAVGRDDVLVGRLRVEPGRIALWLACDRLTIGGPTLGARAVEAWLDG